MMKAKKQHGFTAASILQNILRLDEKRAFYGVVLVLIFTPLALAAFLLLNANMQGLGVMGLMKAQPYTAVMTIVGGLDLIIGYTMWMARVDILTNRTIYRILMGFLMIQQFAVSNFVVGGGAILGLVFSRSVPKKTTSRRAVIGLIVVLALLAAVYLFCLVAFGRLLAH